MMNTWIIASIITGLFVIASFAVVNVVAANAEQETNEIECSSCGNSCNLQRNCGLSSCGAVSGSGSCGCGK